jgi:predicted Zn-dependent protease with MMP-like domain
MKRKFDYYVKRALKELPDEFKEKMDNLVISVEPYPSGADLASLGIRDRRMLLGIFRGVPFGTVSSFYSGPVMPSEIVLFEKNIESMADTEDKLVEQIRITLLHEIGHYFGMSEEELAPYS